MSSTATVIALCPWQGTPCEMGETVQMGASIPVSQNPGSTDMAKPAAVHRNTCADACNMQRMCQRVLKA